MPARAVTRMPPRRRYESHNDLASTIDSLGRAATLTLPPRLDSRRPPCNRQSARRLMTILYLISTTDFPARVPELSRKGRWNEQERKPGRCVALLLSAKDEAQS